MKDINERRRRRIKKIKDPVDEWFEEENKPEPVEEKKKFFKYILEKLFRRQ